MSTSTNAVPLCVWCNRPGPSQCSRCKEVSYCSADCQRKHWAAGHKGQCGALRKSADGSRSYLQTSPAISVASTAKASQHKIKNEEIIAGPIEPSQFLFPPKRVAQMMSFVDPRIRIGVGAVNVGNTCFVNSVLQCLTYTTPLTNYFLSGEHRDKCPVYKHNMVAINNSRYSDDDLQFCIICELAQNMYQSIGGSKPVVPRDILLNIQRLGHFKLLNQEDAHDFKCQILDAFQQALLSMYSPTTEALSEQVQHTTVIHQLFGGMLQGQLRCRSCHSLRSTNYEPILDLSLDLSKGASSVEEALVNFTDIEEIEDYRCTGPCGGQTVVVQKQLTLYTPPNLLTIHLKRFDIMTGGGKINKPVIFREELSVDHILSYGLKRGQYIYHLYALVVHYGATIFKGHYVAFIKFGEQWYLFDDDKVYEVAASTVMKQNAYMLFYHRADVAIQSAARAAPASVDTIDQKPASSSKPKISKSKQTSVQESTVQSAESTLGVSNLQISTPPKNSTFLNATPGIKTKIVPKFKIYYRLDHDDSGGENMRDFVLIVNAPLLARSSAAEPLKPRPDITVNADGRVQILSEDYFLNLHLPFTLVPAGASCTCDEASGTLVVVLPISRLVDEGKSDSHGDQTSLLVPVDNQDGGTEIAVDTDHEVPIEHIPLEILSLPLSTSASSTTTPVMTSSTASIAEKRALVSDTKISSNDKTAAHSKFWGGILGDVGAQGGRIQLEEDNMERQEASYRSLYEQIADYQRQLKVEHAAATSSVSDLSASKKLADKKIGRNDDCPCGSGKKYKRCHGS